MRDSSLSILDTRIIQKIFIYYFSDVICHYFKDSVNMKLESKNTLNIDIHMEKIAL